MIKFLKKGNGSAWIGMCFVILIYVLCLLCVSFYNFFDAKVVTQTHTDAIADAMAIAANDGTGVPNEPKMNEVKTKMQNELNRISSTQIIDVTYDRERLYGIEDDNGAKILELHTFSKTPVINNSFFQNNGHYLTDVYYEGSNTTKIMIDPTVDRNLSFPDDILYAVNLDNLTTYNGTYPMPPDLYREIIIQMQVDRTRRYQPRDNETRHDIYLWDVTRALGIDSCQLPFHYKTANGEPWQILEDGHISDAGNSRFNVQSVRAVGGFLEFLKTHIPDLISYYNVQHYNVNSWSKYSNWTKIADNDDIWSLRRIQGSANVGYPTVLLFENGSLWIVVPELEHTDSTRGLLVSFATNVPSFVSLSNLYTRNTLIGYREPIGNFVAIQYRE